VTNEPPSFRQFAFFTWIAGLALALLLSISSDLFSRNGIFEAAGIFAAGIPELMARVFMRRLSVRGVGFAGGVPGGDRAAGRAGRAAADRPDERRQAVKRAQAACRVGPGQHGYPATGLVPRGDTGS